MRAQLGYGILAIGTAGAVLGAATLIANPALFIVMLAFVALVPVPAYPPAFSEMPDEFTVHVTFVCAVFRPIPSVDARAVVR